MKWSTVLGILIIGILGYLFVDYIRDDRNTEHDKIRRERDSLITVIPAIQRNYANRLRAWEDSLDKLRPAVDTVRITEYFNSRTAADSLRRLVGQATSLRDSVTALVKVVAADSVALGRADSIIQATGKLLAITEGALAIANAQLSINETLYNSLVKTKELDCYILGVEALGRCPSHTVTFVAGAVAGATVALVAR